MSTIDPAAIAHLSKDPVMARMIAETPPPKVFNDYEGDLYITLLESIVSQQISTKAAEAIFKRVRALFPDHYPHADQLLAKTTDELRAAGLSAQKIRYLHSVAEFSLAESGDLPALSRARIDAMTDEEIVRYLVPIQGVGRWTVEMLLMFVLDRPDVFPIDDLVIRQRMVLAYPAQTEGLTGKALYKVLHEIADTWRPYRTTASRYLWQWPFIR